jgi:hypothetical protein
VVSPLHPSSRVRKDIHANYTPEVENSITIVSLAVGDGLGAGSVLETFNDTEDSVRIVLNNRKKYLTALEVLHKHNIRVGTPSQFVANQQLVPLKIMMRGSSSQRSSYGGSETSSYQNITPSTIVQGEGEEMEELEDVAENCIVATDLIEMKGQSLAVSLSPSPNLSLEIAHFAPYALAAYSTLMYLYVNPCCGLCQLCHFSACTTPMGLCNPCARKPGRQDVSSCCCACGRY